MLISYSHRFIFIHVVKTGGISMREVLEPLSTEPEKFRMRRPSRIANGRPNPLYTVWETMLQHAKARDIRREIPAEVFDGFFKFAFVRNPWDLQVSMYHFILRETAMPKHETVKALGSFDAFVEWVVATDDPYPRRVPKLQREMVTDEQGKSLVDFIGHYERLSEDYAHICQVLGIDAPPLPHRNKSEHRDYRSYYNGHTRKLVEDHFQPDIELFQYTFDGLRQPALAGVKA